eukprot:18381-Heterococcus_DN1.PRE.4
MTTQGEGWYLRLYSDVVIRKAALACCLLQCLELQSLACLFPTFGCSHQPALTSMCTTHAGMYETSRMTVFLGGHEVCTWPLLTTFCMAMGYALTTGFNSAYIPLQDIQYARAPICANSITGAGQ